MKRDEYGSAIRRADWKALASVVFYAVFAAMGVGLVSALDAAGMWQEPAVYGFLAGILGGMGGLGFSHSLIEVFSDD